MSAGDQYVPTAIDQVADVLAERDEIIRNLRAELDRVRGEGMDAVDREDRARTARDAANLEIARLKVMLGHMTRIVRQYEIPHGLFTCDNTRLVEAETALTPKEPSDG